MLWLRRLGTDLSPRCPGLFPRLAHVLFKAHKVAVGQFFSHYFSYLLSIISLIPCVRISFIYHRCFVKKASFRLGTDTLFNLLLPLPRVQHTSYSAAPGYLNYSYRMLKVGLQTSRLQQTWKPQWLKLSSLSDVFPSLGTHGGLKRSDQVNRQGV